jgi:hypothetical protein
MIVGAVEVESFTYGFALLTAAPGDRWLQADELRTCVLQDRFVRDGSPSVGPSIFRPVCTAVLRRMQ